MSQFTERNQKIVKRIESLLGDRVVAVREQVRQLTVEVQARDWVDTCTRLRDDAELEFDMLVDLCGVDFLGYGDDEWETAEATGSGFSRGVDHLGPGRFDWASRPEAEAIPNRFAVVVHLLSTVHNHRVRLRCHPQDAGFPTLPSLVDVWASANWYEREAFDLFGIMFEGHPDLRRLLTDYGFIGHPFRKDFPLIGNVTVRYDEEKKRVVYEPTEIEPRVLVPRVIRQDSRYVGDQLDRREGGL
ncbi:NADH-quinone oxidoreductase subunit C [Wenzhouxiangella sp. XN79A]|uniref:NADH-quinone oxidoreductase subunit C n=1 Tax=Wenzhouxiangella sp. XN79A TaxID=2724193 RepID=UPI00144A8ADF|nr:NADH-quinone oxidoreductase subunit C [Wenzhouxiangella sp. XN79A]NKI35736.1 NADH-quinone oxidoreductase subunit C [Wenzhouxiangella sp. XN79A]